MRARALLPAFGLLAAGACNEARTPTEPGPASTVHTPAPTPVSGVPAQLTGRITWTYGPDVGVVVECQGRSATTAADGTFRLDGLTSGSDVTVTLREAGNANPERTTIPLYPGVNTLYFDMG